MEHPPGLAGAALGRSVYLIDTCGSAAGPSPVRYACSPGAITPFSRAAQGKPPGATKLQPLRSIEAPRRRAVSPRQALPVPEPPPAVRRGGCPDSSARSAARGRRLGAASPARAPRARPTTCPTRAGDPHHPGLVRRDSPGLLARPATAGLARVVDQPRRTWRPSRTRRASSGDSTTPSAVVPQRRAAGRPCGASAHPPFP
jgi:hypothetical protein